MLYARCTEPHGGFRCAALVAATAVCAIGCPRAKGTARAAPDAAVARSTDRRPVVFRVVDTRGDVRWQRAGGVGWTAVANAQELRPADGVQTMAQAHATLRFTRTGALATLEPDTTLRVPDQPPEEVRLTHLSGRLLARLDGDGETRRLLVDLAAGTLVLDRSDAASDADDRRLEARVDVVAERTEITVLHGRARLERHHAPAVAIARDHFLAVDAQGTMLAAGRTGPAVRLVRPMDGVLLRTRAGVRLEWAAVPDVERYAVQLRTGDQHAAQTMVESTGTTVTTDLPSGEWHWTVRAFRAGEALPSSDTGVFRVEVDRLPPPLDLTSPEAGAAVSGETVLISGRTERGAAVQINGRAVPTRADGSFSVQQPVARGFSNLVVRSSDDLGNVQVISRTVLRSN